MALQPVAPPRPPARSQAASLAAVALAGAALSTAVTVYTLDVYLPSLNTPHTSIEGVPHEPSPIPPNPALARRLSFIIVDGLTVDVARTLDDLLPLRRRGVFRSLAVEFPTYTSPALVSFVTGLGPRDSGTRRNGDLQGVPGLDTVLLAAADAGVPLRVFLRSFTEGVTILAPPPGTAIYEGRIAPAVEMARRNLAGGDLPALEGKHPARALDFVHWGEVDETGHRHGAASPEYLAQARNAAGFVRSYARTLDLEQDALIVLSDHGHLPEGGHGGDEPAVSHAFFLGVGGLFRRGVELGERPMRDVASTLAVLAGIRVPSSNLGLPMLDALSLGDVETSAILAGPFDESARFHCRVRPAPRCDAAAPLVARLRPGDPTAWEEASALHADLSLAHGRDLDARRERGGLRRLALAAAALLALAFAIGLRLRSRLAGLSTWRTTWRRAWPAALAPIVNAEVFAAVLLSRGYRPTFSRLLPVSLFADDAIPAGALAIAAVALLAWRTRPGRGAPWVLLGATAAPYALLAAYVGCDPVTPPPNVAGVLVFLLGPALPSAAVGAVVMAWMAMRRARAEPLIPAHPGTAGPRA